MSGDRVRAYVPPAVMLVVSAVFLVWSYGYEERARQMPVLVGWTMLVLCVLDLTAVSETGTGRAIKAFFAGKIVGEAESGAAGGPVGKAIVAMLWPTGFVALVYVFGFLPVIPVYVFAFVVVQGRRPVRHGLWAALVTALFTWIVFEELMRYDVYRGLVFGGA